MALVHQKLTDLMVEILTDTAELERYLADPEADLQRRGFTEPAIRKILAGAHGEMSGFYELLDQNPDLDTRPFDETMRLRDDPVGVKTYDPTKFRVVPIGDSTTLTATRKKAATKGAARKGAARKSAARKGTTSKRAPQKSAPLKRATKKSAKKRRGR